MLARPRSLRLRALAPALVLAALAQGCGGAGAPPKAAARTGHCAPEHLDACERALPFAPGTDAATRIQLDDYIAARAAKAGDDDGWVVLWRALGPKDAAKKAEDVPVAVLEGAVPEEAEARAREAGATIVRVRSLPKPDAIADVDLLVAIGRTAGRRLFVRVRPEGGGARVEEIFAGDPLGPFVAGLRPVARDDAALAHLAKDAELAGSVARALHEASQFHYVDAAEEAERLAALVKARDPLAEPTLRGRYALQLLGAAGLVLEPEPGTEPAAATDPPPFPAPKAADTAYGDLLRVRLATKDPAAEWATRRAHVLAEVPSDRRDALDTLFAPKADCAAASKAPPMDGPRDLLFGARLAYAAARGPRVLASASRGLPLETWLPRYEAFVDAVDATDTMWSFAPVVLYERGDALDAAGSTAYRRVSTLGLEHLRAVRKLEQAYPSRFPALAHVPLDYAAGLLSDPKLRDELVGLNRAAIDDRIGGAKDAGGVFEGAIAGIFAGMSYPAALQGPHFQALDAAFSKKLHGDMTSATGWKVAGLYAADALAHVLRGDAPDVAFSRDQILRALADPKEPMPGLAALARAATRYVALGLSHDLDPTQRNPAHFSAERRAARGALAEAIAGLGEPAGLGAKGGDAAPPGLLADVTDLGDGVVAALAARLSEKRDKPAPGTCAPAYAPSPAVARTLAKLGDVRLRILASPHFKHGDGAWVRRARLIVTALSDALDLLAKRKDKLAFTVSDADADAALAGALRDVPDRDTAEALASGYGLARAALTAKDARDFADRSGGRVRGLLRGLAGMFGGGGSASGANTLVAAFAGAKDAAADAHDVTSALLAYARAFYGEKREAQGDLLLLGSLAASALSHREPAAEAIALATEQKSRLAWALAFLAEASRAEHGAAPAPARFADGMRRALEGQCAVGSVDEVLGALGAIRDHAAGKKVEARRALDALLDEADAKGLAIPKITYKYEESTKTKVFTLSLDVSYGAGLLTGANDLQVGLGMRSTPEPIGRLSESFTRVDDDAAAEEAARWYVHVAALAAAWHFLDGDDEHAMAAARRVVSATIDGMRLGPRAVRVDKPGKLAVDARELVALDAELAAEAGHPFLAGDLWTVVKSTLAEDTSAADVAKLLDDAPLGLGGEPEGALKGPLERARRALGVLAARLPCVGGKVDTAPYDDGSCQGYTTGLALRIADALPALPHLRKGAELGAPRCAPLRAVDDFLTLGERRNYDPDAFTRAVDALRGAGRLYDAAVVFTRQRLETHCSPAIVATARELGRAPTLGPVLRSSLLGVAINCTVNAPDPGLADDLVALDHETAAMADPSHNLRLLLFTAELALGRDQWPLLARLVALPDFVSRWVDVSPSAATAALVVDHASHVMSDTPIDLARTAPTFGLLCDSLPAPERAATCASLRAMRDREKAKAPQAEREKAARAALESLVRGVSEPAKKKPKP